MKSYETIWEIFNKCPNNQMRDVFIDEVEVADTDAYIRQKFQDKNATFSNVCRIAGAASQRSNS